MNDMRTTPDASQHIQMFSPLFNQVLIIPPFMKLSLAVVYLMICVYSAYWNVDQGSAVEGSLRLVHALALKPVR